MGLDLFLEFAYSSKPEAVFSVLGIDSSNLDFSAFGPGKEKKGKYATIYGRMLRAVIKGTISYFYMKNASRVFVDRLFHDEEGNLENSIWFDHQTINLTQKELFKKDTFCFFRCNNVNFVNSDSNKEPSFPEISELIQLVDILVGAVSHCYESTSINDPKNLLSKKIMPFLDPQNKDLYNKYIDVSFFPSKRISDTTAKSSLFYKNRYPKQTIYGNKQIF